MIIRHYFHTTLLLFIICSLTLGAQESNVYLDPLSQYKEGVEYYERGNYSLAQAKLERFLRSYGHANKPDNGLIMMDAAYRSAVSAKHLENLEARSQLTEFIEQYGNNRRYNSWANFHLGDLFFAKKKYRESISCYEQIFSEDLDGEFYETYYFQSAYSYFALEKFDEAYERFQNVRSNKGKFFNDAQYYMGYISFSNEKYDQSLQHFWEVENDQRYKNIIPYYITQIYYHKGLDDKVLAYGVPKLKSSKIKYKKEMHKLVGQTYFDNKQFEEALPHLTYYVEKSNKVDKEDLYLLGFTQYKQALYDKAIENFLDLNTLQDSIGQNALYHLADCYLKTNEKPKARAAFDDASKMNFDQHIKEVSAFNYGKLSYELQINSVAITALTSFIETYPKSDLQNDAKSLLSQVLESTRNYKEAIEIIESISNKTPQLKRSYQKITYYRGLEFHNSKQYTAAIEHFNKSLNYPIDNAIVAYSHFWKGDIYFNKKSYGQSVNEFKKYLSSAGKVERGDEISPGSANYNLGYSFYKRKRYTEAIKYFDKSINYFESNKSFWSGKTKLQRIYADAVMRSADCNFIKRDYTKAKSKYEKVIGNAYPGSDYAYYQVGMIHGLERDYAKKISTLRKLESKFSSSLYTDDALFQIAVTQLLQQNYQDAIGTYKSLINGYPKSLYVRKAMVELGLIYFNLNQNDNAKFYYNVVLTKHPKSIEAQEALTGIKDVYISEGDSQGYFAYINGLKGVSINVSKNDTTRYDFAIEAYEQGNCERAINEFTSYLIEFPNGAFTLFAHYYRGECLYRKEEFVNAGKDFDHVLSQSDNLFTEKSLDKASRIAYYVEKNYQKAFQYYKRLYDAASSSEIRTESLRGLMRSAYQNVDKTALKQYADLLLKRDNIESEDITEANYYLGKMAYESSQLSRAQNHLEEVAQRNNGEWGAEARYYIAEALYRQDKNTQAKDACFRVDGETPQQEYWVVKAFILLSDVYRKDGELYQAKATLKSILDFYDGDDALIAEAQRKLDEIEKLENEKSKLDDRPKSNKLEFDDGGNN